MRYSPLLCLLLTACSSIWADTSGPVPELQPVQAPNQETIEKGVQIAAKAAKLAMPLEVSALRKADHGPGDYFVCLREANPLPDKPRPTYSVFFDEGYKDLRLSVILENCEQQQYSSANLGEFKLHYPGR
ncbi:hypothetical protein ACVWWO_001383 [Bradyrhizobium sp. F1.13.1]